MVIHIEVQINHLLLNLLSIWVYYWLDAIYTKKNLDKRKDWATKVLRYAMSNIVLSSYFIKIE